MKKCIILSILLCISCLTGCQKIESESGKPNQEQEILEESRENREDEIEDTNLQAAYASELEDIGLNDKDTSLDNVDSIEEINEYVIPEQSFDIFLDDWGDVTFVSCKPVNDTLFEDASFFLIRDNQILYKFPYLFENNNTRNYIGIFDSVGAVAFRDINDDKKDDIIVIVYYISGAGPTGMVPRPGVRIFLAGENDFYLANDMITDIEMNIGEKDRTIDNVCNYLQNKD